ncbi:glycosyltransferase family 2 protein [Candidatus Electronema sp. JM]|uniref:glycosyltransferase family 2 protein n=1 Tax=Candidatus Electronema sp. JM TaxID=3401571 RepID=UPI003AA91829
MRDLTIVIPAYNDAEALSVFLPELISYCQNNGCKLIIVNDGSSDNTKTLLEQHRALPFFTPLLHKVNRGYGGAIKTGIGAVQTPYVITIDADGQHRLEDVSALHNAMRETDADMIVGSRGKHKEATYRKIGKSLIRFIANLLMPIKIQDINSGMKIYRTNLAKQYLQLCPDNMAFSDVITLSFIHHRNLVLAHPITVLPRTSGTSTISTKTAFDTVMELLNIVMLFNPTRIFLPPAIFFLLFSAVWGLPFILRDEGVSVGTLLLFLTGVMFFFLGLFAEQLAAIRNSLNRAACKSDNIVAVGDERQ